MQSLWCACANFEVKGHFSNCLDDVRVFFNDEISNEMDRWKAKGPIRRKIAKRLEERKRRSTNSETSEAGVYVEGCLEDEFDDLGEEVSKCNWGEESEEPKKKPWLETSKEVYEQQLQSMQEQLENAMVEKMALEGGLVYPSVLSPLLCKVI